MDANLLLDLDDLTPHGLIDFNLIYSNDEWHEEEMARVRNFASVSLSSITRVDDKLKHKIRSGIPCTHRRKIWFVASGGLDLYKEAGNIWDELAARADELPQDKDIMFGSSLNIFEFLPADGAVIFNRFMRVVKMQNEAINYAPMITSICLFLLLFMEPPLAYLSVQAMINRSKEMAWYIASNRDRYAASVFALRDLGWKSCKSVIKHAEDILGLSISRMWSPFVPTFFLPLASLPAVLTLFDVFVSEGRKILSRLCVGILMTEKELLLKATTDGSFIDIVKRTVEEMDSVTKLKSLLKTSFRITMSRAKHLVKAESKFVDAVPLPDKELEGIIAMLRRSSVPEVQPIVPEMKNDALRYFPTTHNTAIPHVNEPLVMAASFPLQRNLSTVWSCAQGTVIGGTLLSIDLMNQLRKSIPHNIRHFDAALVFSMCDNGTTFAAMLERCSTPGFYLLVIQTSTAKVGALLSDALHPTKRCYYGRNSMFVFDATRDKVYQKKTPPNTQYMFVGSDEMIVGGPKPAIYIQDQFKRMGSEPCETFGSPCLCSSDIGDEIYEVEVYRLQIPR